MNWLINASISKKIIGSYSAIALFIAISVSVVLMSVLDVDEINTRILEVRVPTLLASTTMVSAINHSQASLSGWILFHQDKFKFDREKSWQTIDEAYKELQSISQDWTDSDNIKRLEGMAGILEELRQAQEEVQDSTDMDDTLAMDILKTRVEPRTVKILNALDEIAINQEKLADDVARASATAQTLVIRLAVLGFASAVFTIIVAIFVTRMVVVPVARAAKGLRFITNGKLGKHWRVTYRDELGLMLEDLNKMSESISAVVTDVVNAALSIDVSAKQISSGTMDLSQRTEEQASSLQETASSMEEMTSTVKQNAENAVQASQLAHDARNQAEAGGRVVHDAVKAMGEINASSNRIVDIIAVVEEISFQTNLLALNAAVEAARAGDSGRGFAVVASEVRVLAKRSADAAKEIKTLIMDSQSKVKAGAELVDKSGESLHQILAGVKKVSEIVSEIAAASNEQASGIEQVNKAIAQMDEMTQMNASLVEEAASASRSMEEQATQLSERIEFFELDGYQKVASKSAKQSKPAQKQKKKINMPVIIENSPRPKIISSNDDGDWKDF